MAELADFDVDGHRHDCIAYAVGARCECAADLFVVAQEAEQALARAARAVAQVAADLAAHRPVVLSPPVRAVPTCTCEEPSPIPSHADGSVVVPVDALLRCLRCRGHYAQGLRAGGGGHRGPMTTNENAPESTEVSVETPAKVTTTTEVDATPESAGPAEPDAATEDMEVEPKEQPTE